jgi:hypothetical protein
VGIKKPNEARAARRNKDCGENLVSAATGETFERKIADFFTMNDLPHLKGVAG